jgi:hypothetical protein
VEVKIGVLHSTRELTLESQDTPESIEEAVTSARTQGFLRLDDVKGSRILVPAENLAYVEIGAARRGGVGFGSL